MKKIVLPILLLSASLCLGQDHIAVKPQAIIQYDYTYQAVTHFRHIVDIVQGIEEEMRRDL